MKPDTDRKYLLALRQSSTRHRKAVLRVCAALKSADARQRASGVLESHTVFIATVQGGLK